MIKRQYSKNGTVGKIYKWVEGNDNPTDSCSVRNAVLFKAPIKALFGLNLFWIEPLECHLQLWFVWATMAQVYGLLNFNRIFVDLNPIGLEGMILAFSPILGLITIIEAFVIVLGFFSIVLGLTNRAEARIKRLPPVASANEFVVEWWRDFKNKICKPVEWVE